MKYIREHINLEFIFLFSFSVLNLLMMHFLQYREGILEYYHGRISWALCLFSTVLDVSFLYALSCLIFWKNRTRSLILTFAITWGISFINVYYARFFKVYLPLTALKEVRNFIDPSLWIALPSAFRVTDLLYILFILVFIFFYKWLSRRIHSVKFSMMIMLFSSILMVVPANIQFAGSLSELFFPQSLAKLFPNDSEKMMWPNTSIFHTGMLRGKWVEKLLRPSAVELNDEDIVMIEEETEPSLHGTMTRTAAPELNNVIFILVESYLSMVSDLTWRGGEVTPFLNHLRHCDGVYYNGYVKSNITLGESFDGQFISMTGLLPLRREITASRVLGNQLIGLPKALGYEPGNARVIIPTTPAMWQQDRISCLYGFGNLYSKLDCPKGWDVGEMLNDKQVFSLARLKDEENKSEPFCSLILTISMHSAYDKIRPFAKDFVIEHSNDYSEQFNNYLTYCRYTDYCIKGYFDYLKESGLYEKSLIVIAADHPAHEMFLGVDKLPSNDTPLYIVNGGIRAVSLEGKGTPAWDGPCNQVDIFPTILDIMGSKSHWRGLGRSLLMTGPWTDSATDEMWDVSENIIYGNYFAGR